MKTVLTIFFVSISVVCFTQEKNKDHKLEYKSFSFSPLAIYFDNYTGGLVINADLSFAYEDNIFTFSAVTGSEFVISVLGESKPDSFKQLNLSFGKEVKLNKIIYFDMHAGLGYFSFKSISINTNKSGYERSDTIGFPLLTKIRFKTGNKFSLGLCFQANINSINNVYSTGIILQWNRSD